ncbi:response regulator transcription factor [Lentzea sp. NPDC102401]|uniref:response regulator n=1 Tax=Lentzea sp. NPDC102401 TaxID=3364128 RepID=UPI003827E0B0
MRARGVRAETGPHGSRDRRRRRGTGALGFRLILRAAGDIEVVATVTGAQAVEEVSLHRPDVVLFGIRMPGVDGLTILRQPRGSPKPPVVAMLTTFDSDEYIAAALRSGRGRVPAEGHRAGPARAVRPHARGGWCRAVAEGHAHGGGRVSGLGRREVRPPS